MGDIGTLVDVVGGQIWPTGSKQNHFQIQVLETSHDLFKTFTNEHCNSKCTMWLWEKCESGFGQIIMWNKCEMSSKIDHYNNVRLAKLRNYDTPTLRLAQGKICIVDSLLICAPMPISHQRELELNCIHAEVWMCYIMCGTWASASSPNCGTLVLQKKLIHGPLLHHEAKVMHPFSKPFPHIFHLSETKTFAFVSLESFYSLPMQSEEAMWGVFWNLFYGYYPNRKWYGLK